MFVLGLDCYGSQAFISQIYAGGTTKLELSNGMYDEWKTDNALVDYKEEKEIWGYDTIFLATFNNTLEAGNISNNGYDIDYLVFKRRNIENLAWTTFAKIKYDPSVKYYQLIDRLAMAGETYEYCVVPVAGSIEGQENIQQVDVEFDNVWIVDNSSSVRLIYDINYGDISYRDNTTTIDTLENKYPFTFTTPLSYREGSNGAKLISETSAWNSKLDIRSERKLRENILKFISDRKPKMIKDGLGRAYIVMIKDIVERPYSDFNGAMVDVEFNWVEIGDATSSTDLENVGLLNTNY